MKVYPDLIHSQRAGIDSEGNFSAERVFLVDDVTGSPDALLYYAITAPGIPQHGDAHPVIPNIEVTDVAAEPMKEQPDQVMVTVLYSKPGTSSGEDSAGNVVISSALISDETHFDINGEFIKASYSSSSLAITTDYSAVEVQRPQMRVTLTRTENDIPKSAIETYLGRINLTDWSGFRAGTWLCSGISVGEDNDKYSVEYNFDYRAEGWRGELVLPISTADIQEFPIDKDTGNGYALFDVYESVNFNNLGLSF